MLGIDWKTYFKVWAVSGALAAVANTITSWKADPTKVIGPLEAIPGLLIMLGVIIVSVICSAIYKANISKPVLPTIVFISLIGMLISIPGFSPIADMVATYCNKVGLLPLCTPILAYAGISVGKDLNTFKEQGIGIVITTCFAFIGTFVGSAIICNIVLKLTGVI